MKLERNTERKHSMQEMSTASTTKWKCQQQQQLNENVNSNNNKMKISIYKGLYAGSRVERFL